MLKAYQALIGRDSRPITPQETRFRNARSSGAPIARPAAPVVVACVEDVGAVPAAWPPNRPGSSSIRRTWSRLPRMWSERPKPAAMIFGRALPARPS